MVVTTMEPMLAALATVAGESFARASHRFTAAFVPHKCDHEAIFGDVYLRTNRTNHTKIMRCFPHCCPDHRKRSYCGSAIHLRVQAESKTSGHDLVVFGRFRPHDAPPIAVGGRVSLASIESSLQRENPSQGEWVESGLVSDDEVSDSWLFEVNPSGRWYYPWSGAATIAMRSTEHVFEALAFRRCANGQLEVVASSASQRFRLMSFRRGTAATSTTSKDAADASDEASPRNSPRRAATTREASPTQDRRPMQHRRQEWAPVRASTVNQTVHHERPPPAMSTQQPRVSSQPTTTASKVGRRRPHEVVFSARSPAEPFRVSPRRVPPSVRTSELPGSTLSLLLNWLHELPASSVGSRWMLSWERMVQDACEAHVAASHESGGARAGLVPILSALDVATRSASPIGAPAAAVSPLDAIDAAVRAVLNEWLSVDSARASKASISRFLRDGFSCDRSELATAHANWLRNAETRTKRFVHAHTRATWSHLATTTSTFSQQQQQRQVAAAGCDDEFGYRAFVAQCRQRFVHQHQEFSRDARSHKRHRSGRAAPWDIATSISALPLGLRNTSPVWVCPMEDVSIEMDSMTQHALTLLSIMQFWKHLSCIRLDCSAASAQAAQLSVASVFNTIVADYCFTRFVLDGKHRWFNSMPTGDATTGTTLMGFVVGDYVGYTTSAGTIHVTMYMWPSSATQTRAYSWHWMIDAQSLVTNNMVMNIVMESAPVQTAAHPMETMTMAEKLQSVGRWEHVCELRLAYRAQ